MRARVIAILAACSVCGSEELLARPGGPLRPQDSAPRPIHEVRPALAGRAGQALIDASASCVRHDALPRRHARDRLLTPQFCPDPALAGPGPDDL
jgi:hypothetical protein